MSARARVRDAKHARREPFATIRQDVLLAIALTLPGRATRIYWLANAAWAPDRHVPGIGVESGTARLSVRWLQRPHRPNRPDPAIIVPSTSTIREGTKLLRGDDAAPAEPADKLTRYLILKTPGVRPGGPGGAAGMAAEYDIPHRHSVNVPTVSMPPNVRRPDGKLRQHAARIRHDIARMSETEITVFTYAVAHRDRTRQGTLNDLEPFALPLNVLTTLLGIARSTLGDAIKRLVERKLMIIAAPGRGRRPATYRLPKAWEGFA